MLRFLPCLIVDDLNHIVSCKTIFLKNFVFTLYKTKERLNIYYFSCDKLFIKRHSMRNATYKSKTIAKKRLLSVCLMRKDSLREETTRKLSPSRWHNIPYVATTCKLASHFQRQRQKDSRKRKMYVSFTWVLCPICRVLIDCCAVFRCWLEFKKLDAQRTRFSGKRKKQNLTACRTFGYTHVSVVGCAGQTEKSICERILPVAKMLQAEVCVGLTLESRDGNA